jgi:hypothetical protein
MITNLDVLGEVYTPPKNDLSLSSKRYFGGISLVAEVPSNDDPPVIKNQNGQWDTQPNFDGFLGMYEPRKRRITIFNKAIVWVANANGWDPGRLERIVKLHEWAHALHHLGTFDSLGAINLRTCGSRYRAASAEMSEQIAQLATLVTLKTSIEKAQHKKSKEICFEIQEMFFFLMERQSSIYWLPSSLKEVSPQRLAAKLKLLFQISDRKINLVRDEIWEAIQ